MNKLICDIIRGQPTMQCHISFQAFNYIRISGTEEFRYFYINKLSLQTFLQFLVLVSIHILQMIKFAVSDFKSNLLLLLYISVIRNNNHRTTTGRIITVFSLSQSQRRYISSVEISPIPRHVVY